jgi:hypothetical protein
VDRVIDKACRGAEVPLRALWYKRGFGAGRLQHAATREGIHIEVNAVIL